MTAPHERHTQPCQNATRLTFDELHALAGKWDRYPSAPAEPLICPVCGGALPALATYCSDICRHVAQKRLMTGAFRRAADEPGIRYSFAPPTK